MRMPILEDSPIRAIPLLSIGFGIEGKSARSSFSLSLSPRLRLLLFGERVRRRRERDARSLSSSPRRRVLARTRRER